MAKLELTTKRLQIDKANAAMVVAVSVAVFVVIFSLVATYSLAQRYAYQSKVIATREIARDRLASNVKESEKLTESYKQFVSNQENIIGGSSSGNGSRDGDNGRIVLDALPSKYDFPAVTTSIDKLVKDEGVRLTSISGVDDEVNQSQNDSLVNPTPVEMPFELSVEGNYNSVISFIQILERSIRPFVVTQTILTSGDSSKVNVSLKLKTFYQPAKSLQLRSEVVQ